MTGTRSCSVDGCDRDHYAHGLCMTHYQRQRRHGSPEIVHRRGRKPRAEQEARR
ncbi:hypothetical protein [Mycolicibacterium austroafricanum]|uniref:hypothetical protein n=1 Tax=Mycolicibacterium austroafricanum TaxID=39687 RepID=UPI001CA33576|nr:hypothetical protein [Mycolicibacterium austroafricanum]QZT60930.1 hypothetical protein JN085_18170 [Mycolicibacterium austroafricanum]